MNIQTDPLGAAGLTFFSKVSASISHEIKNSLAVMHESAGYLEDLTLMTRKGVPLDPDRLAALAATMLKQVHRSDTIVKNMNRLAHTLDEESCRVDLNETVELMAHLSERTLVTKGFSMTVNKSAHPPMVITHPFFLQNLIWLVLNYAMTASGENKSLLILVSKTSSGAEIRFEGLTDQSDEKMLDFFARGGKIILAALKAACRMEAEQGCLTIDLPENPHPPKSP